MMPIRNLCSFAVPSRPEIRCSPAGTQQGGAANGAATFGSFAASSFPGMPAAGSAPIFGSGSRNFESATLARMRQRAERDRLIAEMAAKDAED